MQLTVIRAEGSHDHLKSTQHVKTISQIDRKNVEMELGYLKALPHCTVCTIIIQLTRILLI